MNCEHTRVLRGVERDFVKFAEERLGMKGHGGSHTAECQRLDADPHVPVRNQHCKETTSFTFGFKAANMRCAPPRPGDPAPSRRLPAPVRQPKPALTPSFYSLPLLHNQCKRVTKLTLKPRDFLPRCNCPAIYVPFFSPVSKKEAESRRTQWTRGTESSSVDCPMSPLIRQGCNRETDTSLSCNQGTDTFIH